jgi:formylglycine-generating enzyme required for sulfatase activity
MKFKKTVGLLFVFSIIALSVSLITCVNPLVSDKEKSDGKGVFTIIIGNNNERTNNSRAAGYPPTTAEEIADLKFIVNFTPLKGGAAQTFSSTGSKDLKGYIDIGHYKVTLDIFTVSDNQIYARGVAEYNPVEIKAENNFINVFVYKAANAYPPVVSEQPRGAAYHDGAPAVAMRVTVDAPKDGGTIKYQWYSNKNDENFGGDQISGGTSSSFKPSTSTGGTTYYYVMITNYKEGIPSDLITSIPSEAVRIYVGNDAEPPEITQQPEGDTVPLNSITLTLTVKAEVNDGGTLTYQWYSNTVDDYDGTEIPGATSKTYTPPTTNYGTIYYYVIVTNTNNAAPGANKIVKTESETAMVSVSIVKMVSIPAGTFSMGQTGITGAIPVHSVTLTSGFYMSKYPVTQEQYQVVIGTNPSGFNSAVAEESGTPGKLPVEKVNWYDALVFCNKLSMIEGLSPTYSINGRTDPDEWGTSGLAWNAVVIVADSNGYRLPTEAQWEYACRAGTTTVYNTGDEITDTTGWYNSNSASKTHEVGKKSANAFGLYDMHGNVWEWCWDGGRSYSSNAQTDPMGASASEGTDRAIRGGSWQYAGQNFSSAFRGSGYLAYRANDVGFRLVRP